MLCCGSERAVSGFSPARLPEHLEECEAEILHWRPKIALFHTICFFPAPFAFISNTVSRKTQNKRLKTARNSMNFVLARCYNAWNNRYFAFVTFKTPNERVKNKAGVVSEMPDHQSARAQQATYQS